MGVTRLAKLLKEGCSVDVNLDGVDGDVVIVDGHWLAHRALTKPGVAITLMNDCPRKLAFAVRSDVRRFQQKGFLVVLVVDGKVPPAKGDTSGQRAARRAHALSEMENPNSTPAMQAELAKQAARLTPELIARMLTLVREATKCEIVVSPYEADGQLLILERLYLRHHPRVYVYAADNDLMVLGVQSLLWEVRSTKDGSLVGKCTLRSMMLSPSPVIFFDDTRGKFLRRLHGWTSHTPRINNVLNERTVTRRLLAFALLAGNDYCNLAGVGPVGAQAVALPFLLPDAREREMSDPSEDFASDAALHVLAMGVSIQTNGRVNAAEAGAALRVAHDMFRHQVAWNPETGMQEHISGVGTRPSLASSTGAVILDRNLAGGIACGKLSPFTGLEWQPALKQDSLVGFQTALSEGGTGTGHGFGPGGPTGNPYTYHETAAARMPDPSDKLTGWTMDHLAGALNELRCTERAGIGGFTREELVQLTHWCSKVLQESGLAGNRLLFRQPQIPTTHVDILHQVFPDLPPPGEHWSTDYDTLIPYLPEMQEAVILAWLCLDGERKNWSNPPTEDGTGQPQRWEAPARVLARGMERAMDLGSLTGLKGTFVGNILYVQHRVHASMHQKWYNVYVKIAVHDTAEAVAVREAPSPDQEGLGELGGPGSTARRLATVILRALCECRAGRSGKCHHAAMVLQLLRLLGMTGRELEAWDPTTVTGRTCQWLLNHQSSGRGPGENVFWGMTLPEMAQECRKTRDPKGSPMFSDAPSQSRGVVSINRESDFNGYPQGGAWAEKAAHHLEGDSLSATQKSNYDTFSALVKEAGHREEDRRVGSERVRALEERKVASDVLPPLVRPNPV